MGARSAILWVLVGCYNPTIATEVPCGPNGECPSNQHCDRGSNRCIDGDGGALSDARPDIAIDAATMPSFLGYTYVDGTTPMTTIDAPPATKAGDLLIAHVSDDATTIGNVATPPGWTKVIERNGVQDPHWAGIYYAFVTPTSPSADWTFPNVYNSIAVLAFSNVNANPIDVADAIVVNDTMQPIAPSVTTTRANTILLVMFTQDLGQGAIGMIGGVTNVYSQAGALNAAGGYTLIPDAGPTGTHTAPVPMKGPSIGFSVALAPL